MPHVFCQSRVIALTADITTLAVDAIVNAANSSLLGGGGVDGAIHRRGGAAILEACREIRRTEYPQGLPTGHAVITVAGDLPAAYVIHTVGPVYSHDPQAPALLASCYRNCLTLAQSRGLRRIAFPSISTGVYGYPKDQAAVVASRAIRSALSSSDAVAEVQLVFFSAADLHAFITHQQFG